MLIYKYVPINKFTLSLLIKQKQWVSDPLKFNDPFEFAKSPIAHLIPGKGLHLMSEDEINIQDELEDEISQYGVSCFSQSCDNILLWSHYADNHQGICLGFDIDENLENLYNVNYQENIDTNIHSKEKTQYQNNLIKQITTKGIHWKYENEIRQIFESKSFESIYPGNLSEVIFGCKCSESDIEMVHKLLYNIYKDALVFSIMKKNSHLYGLSKWPLHLDK